MEVLKERVKNLIEDLDTCQKDGGLSFSDLIEYYDAIIIIAENHAAGVKYEAEQIIDALTDNSHE